MKLAVLYSGGKDSNLAMFYASKQNEIVCLINIKSKNLESYMFHTINSWVTKLQAKAMGLPIIQRTTKGEKEKELKDLEIAIKQAIKKYKIEGIVTGAIKSAYQSSRIKKICDKLGIECINPLWQMNEREVVDRLLKEGFEAIVVAVAAYPLGEDLLGKKIDRKLAKKLDELNRIYKTSPAGEGGEFETLVVNSPMFKKRIVIIESKREYSNYSGRIIIKKAKLE